LSNGSIRGDDTVAGIDTLTIGSAQTITGSGTIGASTASDNALDLVNNGTIDGFALVFAPGENTFTNNGIMQSSSGRLDFNGGLHVNNGTYHAADGATIRFFGGARVRDGILSSDGTGNIQTLSSPSFWEGTFQNNANFVVSGSGVMHVSGDVQFNGSGTTELSNGSIRGDDTVAGIDTLTIGSAQTITGNGRIGPGTLVDNALAVINNGVIDASTFIVLEPGTMA
jgi:hypothetical protein